MGTVFFWCSKLVWGLLSPDSLVVFVPLGLWWHLRHSRHRRTRRILGASAAVLVVVAGLPVGRWLFAPLEQRFETSPPLPAEVNGLIVLGGATDTLVSRAWDQVEVNGSAERLLAFLRLARQYPAARLVFTGGSGLLHADGTTEAPLAERLLVEQGLDPARLTLEQASRNTYENALRSRDLVRPDPNETWVLITSAWHMPRAVGVFQRVGWPVVPYPVDHWSRPGAAFELSWDLAEHLRNLKVATKEWVGLLVYRLTGRTDDLLPGGTTGRPAVGEPDWATPLDLPGVPNLYRVSPDLYRSAQPTAAGMRHLEALGIKTVLNLRAFHSDRDELAGTSLHGERLTMTAWHPEVKEARAFLTLIADPNRRPVLVHCQQGADRTGTLCALYRIAVQGWSRERALREMTEGPYGFHAVWLNLPAWIRDLDIEAIRPDGLAPTPSWP